MSVSPSACNVTRRQQKFSLKLLNGLALRSVADDDPALQAQCHLIQARFISALSQKGTKHVLFNILWSTIFDEMQC